MIRFLSSILLLMSTSAIAAEDILLVQSPPVYHSGESAVGVVIGQDGTRLALQQTVQHVGKQAYLLTTFVDEVGNVRGWVLFDPRTWLSLATNDATILQGLSTTCAADTLFPITLGKVYECVTSMRDDDQVHTARSRLEFDTVHRDADGKMIGFCALSTDDAENLVFSARVCMSPDGKWIRSIKILSVAQIQRS